MRAILIPADLLEPIVEYDVVSTFPELNAMFLGDAESLVEVVRAKGLAPLYDGRRAIVMLVDEEGLLKELDLNKRASILYGTHVHGHPICGDALIIAETRDDWIDLPPEVGVDTVIASIARALTDVALFH